MRKNRSTKLLCLLIAFVWTTIVIGSSYAYFIDSVTVTGNVVTSGNLKAGLSWKNPGDEQWKDASEGAIFNYQRWEPGYTDVKYIKVDNTGDLAFQYELNVFPAELLTGRANLLDVLEVYYGENVTGVTRENYAEKLTSVGTLTELLTNAHGAAYGILLPEEGKGSKNAELPAGVTAPRGSVEACMVLHMQETAGNEYMGLSVGEGFKVQLAATQYMYEKDSFGNSYDQKAELPELNIPTSMVIEVTPVNGQVPYDVWFNDPANGVSATVPAGAKMADGVTSLKLVVEAKNRSEANVNVTDDEELFAYNVKVEGLAADNTVPAVINMGEVLPNGLNLGNFSLYHVENGETTQMTLVDTASDLNAHNEFTYDPVTGEVAVAMATFSEVALVADTTKAWEGKFDYSWYTNAIEANADEKNFVIANADQLAAFGAIVGGMNGKTRDSFAGKTVKLVADVNLGDAEKENNPDIIFYPVGYYNSTGSYEKASGGSVTSNVNSFEGTFDGNGHTISNFYQNTWEMFGDYNDGYSDTPNHYKDAMGLFGYVKGGTVKNLTVDNFSSDGEFTPTGVIAAYAVNSTFENIAITRCNPRVYNTGNGGIVGIGGNSDDHDTYKLTFNNITIDNTNKISALWGSWDVACGGLVGMFRGAGHVYMTNCHVAAQMDVYNDVCGNYQYYWYRYSGMMVGTNKNMTTDANGYTVPETDKFHAENCTVHFGEWNDYYYCELVANSLASYTHDHQFSRLEQISSLDEIKSGDTWTKEGNFLLISDNAKTCYHIVKDDDGKLKQHQHADAGEETVNGESVLKEDKQIVYLPFNQLFTGYGWGVKHIPVYNGEDYAFDGITILDREVADSVVKFESKFTGDFLYRVGNQNTVSLGSLFGEIVEDSVVDSGVWVSIDKVADDMDVSGTFKADTSDWTKGTIQFSGTGVVKVTIQDYNFCIPTVLYLEVVEATNLTSATAGTGKNFVLLQNVVYFGTYLYYKNSTLYGNSFTIDITDADHSDLKDSSDTNSNKNAYCNIWMADSRFDNVKVKGSVYPEVGMTADSDYGNAAIRTEGDCYITNSYISNCRVPLRVQGNTTLIDTVVDGGRYANIELRSGKLTLDGVTTINTVRKGIGDKTDVIGFGIVIHSEAANTSIAVIGDGLKQYNWAGENKHKSILSGDKYLSNAYKLIFNANNSDSIYFDYNNDRYVNTGILCLCADMNKDVVTGLDDRYCQEVSGYDAWVLTYDNSKHTAWFDESVDTESIAFEPAQYPVIPTYSGNEAQTVEFTKGETYNFDTSVLTAEKFGQSLTISSVVMNGTTYNYGDKIPITEGGVYEVVYTVVDPYVYNADGSTGETVTHHVGITVTAIAKDAEILAPKFTFIDQNDNKYESTTVKVDDKTYVMPNVTAADPTTNSMSSINIGSVSISGTTVYFPVATGYTVRSGSNFNRYYPLFNGINITDYTIAGDTTGTTYITSGNYTSLVGSSGTKFIIPANGGQTNCGDYVKTDGQAGNAAGNSDSGWQGAGYSTSYGGTYLKSGNTNASSGADKNGYERIVWVEYCFNAGNGDVYYYRIGYHCNKESAQSCVTPDTLVTLADGSQKEIQHVTYEDQLLVWDFYKGEYAVVPAAVLVNHGEGEYTRIDLKFEDGTVVKVLGSHGFFNADLNEWVFIDESNVATNVGMSFVQSDSNGYRTVKLVDYSISQKNTVAFSVLTPVYYNCFVEGMLSLTPSMYGGDNYYVPFTIGCVRQVKSDAKGHPKS